MRIVKQAIGPGCYEVKLDQIGYDNDILTGGVSDEAGNQEAPGQKPDIEVVLLDRHGKIEKKLDDPTVEQRRSHIRALMFAIIGAIIAAGAQAGMGVITRTVEAINQAINDRHARTQTTPVTARPSNEPREKLFVDPIENPRFILE
ncbi:hypothetical protein HY604_03270 [Candidatus Peregrinibacteria bacterium]|nr:hypothetical protein [Candidatus Peregrinibacteria bacterium]